MYQGYRLISDFCISRSSKRYIGRYCTQHIFKTMVRIGCLFHDSCICSCYLSACASVCILLLATFIFYLKLLIDSFFFFFFYFLFFWNRELHLANWEITLLYLPRSHLAIYSNVISQVSIFFLSNYITDIIVNNTKFWWVNYSETPCNIRVM